MIEQTQSVTEFVIKIPDSGWVLKFSDAGECISIALHWGDKKEPTHIDYESKPAFFNMAKAITSPGV